MIHSWTYTGPHIPRPEQPRVHINLWQFDGPPASDQEVIIDAGDAAATFGGVVDVYDPSGGATVTFRNLYLKNGSATWGGVAGSLLGAFEPNTGASLLPLSIDPFLLREEQFRWRGLTVVDIR